MKFGLDNLEKIVPEIYFVTGCFFLNHYKVQLPTLLLLDQSPHTKKKIFGVLFPFGHSYPQYGFYVLIIKRIHGHFRTFEGKEPQKVEEKQSAVSLFRQLL